MKGMLFKPNIWKAKLKVLQEYRETETRRAGKALGEINQEPDSYYNPFPSYDGTWGFHYKDYMDKIVYAKPPYHEGEVVYVKEAWAEYINTSEHLASGVISLEEAKADIIYKAGMSQQEWEEIIKENGNPWVIKSTIMMPEWVARCFLRIFPVRVERLQLPLTEKSFILEGGNAAIPQLEKINNLWVWVYRLELEN